MKCETCGRKSEHMTNIPIIIGNLETIEPQCDECIDLIRLQKVDQWMKAEYN